MSELTPRAGLRRRSAFAMTALAFALLLSLVGVLRTPAAQAQDSVGSYTVVAGDTLFLIAQRFGVSVEDLVALNNIADPSLIQVGQELVIPAASAGLASIPTDLVRAAPGDTLVQVATRYGQDVAVLAALNELSPTARLFPEQPVRLPAGQASAADLRFGAIRAVDAPSQLAQGRTGRLIVTSIRPLAVAADWNGLPLSFLPTAQATKTFAFVPVPALLGPGLFPLTLTYTAANGSLLARRFDIAVVDGGYDSQLIELPPDRAALLDPTLVTDEEERVRAVWSQARPEMLWSAQFLRPIAEAYATTSPFGTRRSYNGGPYASYHAGQDFGVPAGVTVTAAGDAIVALAEPLQVRGNAVILDHGGGVFTGYWHLSEIFVAVGQQVQAGDLIGLSGNTGLSTGAHLHWELRVAGIAVDPLQFLDEPLVRTEDEE